MLMVASVQACWVFLMINLSSDRHGTAVPPAQTLRRVVISTRCSVASRDPSSSVWKANSLFVSFSRPRIDASELP